MNPLNSDEFADAVHDSLLETHDRLRQHPDYEQRIVGAVEYLMDASTQLQRRPIEIVLSLAQKNAMDRKPSAKQGAVDEQIEWLFAACVVIAFGEMEGFDAVDQHGITHTVGYDPGSDSCQVGTAYLVSDELLIKLDRRQQHVWATPDGALVLTAKGLG